MQVMEAAGKRLAMYFDTRAWVEFERKYYPTDELLRRISEGDKAVEARIQLAAVTATAGARREGREEEITPDWLMDNLTPKQIKQAMAMAQNAWIDGMHRETVEEADEDVDAVAAELEKKDPAGA